MALRIAQPNCTAKPVLTLAKTDGHNLHPPMFLYEGLWAVVHTIGVLTWSQAHVPLFAHAGTRKEHMRGDSSCHFYWPPGCNPRPGLKPFNAILGGIPQTCDPPKSHVNPGTRNIQRGLWTSIPGPIDLDHDMESEGTSTAQNARAF